MDESDEQTIKLLMKMVHLRGLRLSKNFHQLTFDQDFQGARQVAIAMVILSEAAEEVRSNLDPIHLPDRVKQLKKLLEEASV